MSQEAIIEAMAKAIWERQRSAIKNPDGINARLTWRSRGAPELFWDGYFADATAALKAFHDNRNALT